MTPSLSFPSHIFLYLTRSAQWWNNNKVALQMGTIIKWLYRR